LITFFGFNAMFIVMACLCFASALYVVQVPRTVL
jgi:hypothetical protein